ncbi:MAG: CHASE3 domain-containing protein [Chitinophagales bacterium]|nr:CHASE3 domain-containing protein [Chitinophagales bacterium]
MKLSFTRKLVLFYAIVMIGLGIIAIAAYRNISVNTANNESVNHSYSVLRKLTRVRALSKDNALHGGNYVITANKQLLQYIHDEKDTMLRTLNELITLTTDNPAQQQRIRSLQASVLQGINFTDKIVAAYTTGGQQAAMQLYAMGESGKINYTIRDKVAEIEREERNLLYKRKEIFTHGEAQFAKLTALLIVCMAVTVTLMFVITHKQIRLRKRAEAEVKDVNEWLEQRVKAKTETIRNQSERFRHLMDNMIEGMQIVGKDWKYIYLNDAAVGQSKLTRERMIGKSIYELYSEKDNAELYHVLKQCMETGQPSRLDTAFTFPDGSTNFFDLSIEPIDDGILILSMDISERKARELERQRRIDEAKEILNKISHDIRQPVSSIVGVSDLLENEMISEDELKTVSVSMKESALLLDLHTRQLSDYVSQLRKEG